MKILKAIFILFFPLAIYAQQSDDYSLKHRRLQERLQQILAKESDEFPFWEYVNLYRPLSLVVEDNIGENIQINASSAAAIRRKTSLEIIGSELYEKLQADMMDLYNKSTEESHKKLAINYLTKILGSQNISQDLLKKFQDYKVLQLNNTDNKDFFNTLEALAYLGEDSVKKSLQSILDDESENIDKRIRALHAMVNLAYPEIYDFISGYLTHENLYLAEQAFVLSEKYNLEFGLSFAVYHNLSSIAKISSNNSELDESQKIFLKKLVNDIIGQNRSRQMKKEKISAVKDLAYRVLKGKNQDARNEYIRILWELADASDEPFLVRLLNDENPVVQAYSAFAFFRLPKRHVFKNSDKLIKLLEHEDYNVRKWSLFSLAYGVDNPISSSIPPDEFERVKIEILQQYD